MTVRELITELQELDQDRDIWVVYDGISAFPPLPDEIAKKYDAGYFSEEGVHEGDYLIIAG